MTKQDVEIIRMLPEDCLSVNRYFLFFFYFAETGKQMEAKI